MILIDFQCFVQGQVHLKCCLFFAKRDNTRKNQLMLQDQSAFKLFCSLRFKKKLMRIFGKGYDGAEIRTGDEK